MAFVSAFWAMTVPSESSSIVSTPPGAVLASGVQNPAFALSGSTTPAAANNSAHSKRSPEGIFQVIAGDGARSRQPDGRRPTPGAQCASRNPLASPWRTGKPDNGVRFKNWLHVVFMCFGEMKLLGLVQVWAGGAAEGILPVGARVASTSDFIPVNRKGSGPSSWIPPLPN